MKKYNRSLDHTTLALTYGRRSQQYKAAGNTELAAKCMMIAATHFSNALTASDVVRAVAVLEVSNKQAWEAEKRVEASTKTPKTKPKAKVKAAEEEFDLGEMDEVEGEDPDSIEDGEEVESAIEEEEEGEDEEEGEGFDAQFAKVLASLAASSTKKPAKAK